MQHFEDELPDGVLARHALRAHFAVAVPGLDAILAIDDVEAERQRVDDARGEPSLGFHFARAAGDFSRQAMNVFGVRELGREQVRHDREYFARLSGHRRRTADGKDADALALADEPASDNTRQRVRLGSSLHIAGGEKRRAGDDRPQEAVVRIQPETDFGGVERPMEPLDHIRDGCDDLATLGETGRNFRKDGQGAGCS